MKLLKCRVCGGEMDVIGGEHSINKKVKCLQCGFSNVENLDKKGPEIIRRRPVSSDN